MKRNKRGGAHSRKQKKEDAPLFNQDVLDEEHVGLGGLENLPETQVFFPPRETDLSEDSKRRLEAIRRAWKTLSAQQKNILALIENWGYTCKAGATEEPSEELLAKCLNLSRSTIKTQLERARAKILEAYKERSDNNG